MKYDRNACEAARKRGKEFYETVCSHMDPPISEPYSIQELIEEARKYNGRGDFQKHSSRHYASALSRGLLDLVCGEHMISKYKYWGDVSLIHKEALLYNTRSDFTKYSHKAYDAALRRGILDQVCSHMRPSRGSSLAERELFGLIKTHYQTAKKIKDYKVNILDKDYIKRFEIDIFVPELNLGIEYDGKYHHSYERMRADPKRAKWSDEDIRNYHDLKDTWFWTSKGIRILHIKEKEWIADKEACIKRCLDFLGGVICP